MKKQLKERTKQFALGIIRLASALPKSRAVDVLAKQVIRSSTSIRANYREANRAFSHDDFIHKISICEKEAAETGYWLELLTEAGLAPARDCQTLRAESNEVLAIFCREWPDG